MARTTARRRSRDRGQIEELPSGSLRVTVYAGVDPLTKRRHYLREIISAGPTANADAEKARRRLVVQVDEQRSPRTAATVGQLLDQHFELLEVDPGTLGTYRSLATSHIVPLIGNVKVGALRAAIFDSFYAELRRCRAHCDRRPYLDHRTDRPHECDHRCGPHICRPLAKSTIRQIHVILSGSLKRAVRWRWLATNPIEHAEAPQQPAANPQPPSAEEAAAILNEAWTDPDWAVLIWLTMVTGFRRGELCALRWLHLDVVGGVLTVARSISQPGTVTREKDTKTHQARRIALDPETIALLTGHRQLCTERATQLGVELAADAFMFSLSPDGSTHLKPRTVGQRYSRLAKRLGIKTSIHKLRHYSATELIAAGVDVRTVAGRLGHGGGGTTTLRVYAAWVSEADQRASSGLLERLPLRPSNAPGSVGSAERAARNPYELAAADLRSQILDGRLPGGSLVPSTKEIARSYNIAVGTAHRAVVLLGEWGLVDIRRGRRAVVVVDRALPATTEAANEEAPRIPGEPRTVTPTDQMLIELALRRGGTEVGRLTAAVTALSARVLRQLLGDAIRRAGEDAPIGDYEMDVRHVGAPDLLMTFVAPS
jgi:integrase